MTEKFKKICFLFFTNNKTGLTWFFMGFEQLVFRSIALITKMLCTMLDFFKTLTKLFTVLYSTLCIKKKCLKNSWNYLSLKVKKCHDDNVKFESARATHLLSYLANLKRFFVWNTKNFFKIMLPHNSVSHLCMDRDIPLDTHETRLAHQSWIIHFF